MLVVDCQRDQQAILAAVTGATGTPPEGGGGNHEMPAGPAQAARRLVPAISRPV